MAFSIFLRRLLTHVASAVLAFSIVIIAMEALMPGSVLPYLNPIPLAIGGLLGLAIVPLTTEGIRHRAPVPAAATAVSSGIISDSRFPIPDVQSLSLWRGRLLLILVTLIVAASLTLYANENGRLGMAVLTWLAVSLIAIVISIWPKKMTR